jgi:hypothetical protein
MNQGSRVLRTEGTTTQRPRLRPRRRGGGPWERGSRTNGCSDLLCHSNVAEFLRELANARERKRPRPRRHCFIEVRRSQDQMPKPGTHGFDAKPEFGEVESRQEVRIAQHTDGGTEQSPHGRRRRFSTWDEVVSSESR